MRVKRVSADDVKLYDLTKVKLKTAGNTQVVQFTDGNNQSCPVCNLSKDEYLDKKLVRLNQRRNLKVGTSLPRVCEKALIV